MAASRDASSFHKAQEHSIQPSEQLDIILRIREASFDDPAPPSLSASPINRPCVNEERKSTQADLLLDSSRRMSIPIHPRIKANQGRTTYRFNACTPFFATDTDRHLPEQLRPYHAGSANENAPDLQARLVPESLEPIKVLGSGLPREVSPETVIEHMRKSGASEDTIRSVYSSPALFEYHRQLMLLEEQNRKRLRVSCYDTHRAYKSGASTSVLPQHQRQLEPLQQSTPKTVRVTHYPDSLGNSVTVINTEIPGYPAQEMDINDFLATLKPEVKQEVFCQLDRENGTEGCAHIPHHYFHQAAAVSIKHGISLNAVRRIEDPMPEGSSVNQNEFKAYLARLEARNGQKRPGLECGGVEIAPKIGENALPHVETFINSSKPCHYDDCLTNKAFSESCAFQEFETQVRLVKEGAHPQNGPWPDAPTSLPLRGVSIPNNNGLQDYQKKLMFIDQQSKPAIPRVLKNHRLQMQLMLIEQQTGKRIDLCRREQAEATGKLEDKEQANKKRNPCWEPAHYNNQLQPAQSPRKQDNQYQSNPNANNLRVKVAAPPPTESNLDISVAYELPPGYVHVFPTWASASKQLTVEHETAADVDVDVNIDIDMNEYSEVERLRGCSEESEEF